MQNDSFVVVGFLNGTLFFSQKIQYICSVKQGFIVVCTACVLLSLWLSQYIPADIFDKIESPLQMDRWMEQEKPYVNPAFQQTDLRAVLPLNRTYLSQFIRAEYGCTFYQWLREDASCCSKAVTVIWLRGPIF